MVDDNNPVDSDSLLAALPVGAREAIFSSTSLSDILLILLYASIIAFTIVVFPVPGPPIKNDGFVSLKSSKAAFCDSSRKLPSVCK